MSTDSAVTSVTPTATRTPRTAKTNGATPAAPATTTGAVRGRPALMLKGGVSYKDAKTTAQTAIREAKTNLGMARTELKERQKLAKSDATAITKAEKNVTNAGVALFRSPKDAVAKQGVVEAKNTLKACQTQFKAATKDVAAQEKVVAQMQKQFEKATDGLNKIEAQKAASLN